MRALAFALIVGLAALSASAAPIVNLRSLSHHGDRAIMTYDRIWADVSLADPPSARRLAPPQGCVWTSMDHAPVSDDIVMAAFCAQSEGLCEDGVAVLMVKRAGAPPLQVAQMRGARWAGVVWQSDGARAHLIETRITRPRAMGLEDLSRTQRRCGWGRPAIKVVDIRSGAVIAFDMLPDTWRPKAVMAAYDGAVTAIVAARKDAGTGSSAADTIAAACADMAGRGRALAPVCKSSGADLVMTWADGDWTLGVGDWRGADAFAGRAVMAPDGATLAREDCDIVRADTGYRLTCALTIDRAGRKWTLSAPEGLFGDLGLSGDGRILAAVAAGRSARNRRFHLWDLDSGEQRSLPALLSPAAHFADWPVR